MNRREKKGKCRKSVTGRLIDTAIEKSEMPDIRLPEIQSRGNRQVCIDGCKGILEYEQGKIRLNCGSLIIGFSGDDIEISEYSDIQTVITGNIFTIDFQGAAEV